MFKFYSFSQDTPAATWTINHNLNTPNITMDTMVYFNGNLEKIIPYDVIATNNNTMTVYFTSAQYGRATLAGGG
jgi:hypothetical protein